MGFDAGLVWVVAAVWTVRAVAASSVGLAWGIACVGAGLSWGTLSLADVAAGTRLLGPGLHAGSIISRAGLVVALAAALIDESRVNGLRAGSRAEIGASVAAIAVLVPLFLVPGPTDPESFAPLWWGLAAVCLTALVLLLEPLVRRLPAWVPGVAAGAGVLAAGVEYL